jgi:hypothetical protein
VWSFLIAGIRENGQGGEKRKETTEGGTSNNLNNTMQGFVFW